MLNGELISKESTPKPDGIKEDEEGKEGDDEEEGRGGGEGVEGLIVAERGLMWTSELGDLGLKRLALDGLEGLDPSE